MTELTTLKNQITNIVNIWSEINLSDVSTILDLRRELSVYYYQLSELKGVHEAKFLTYETHRKNEFNRFKIESIDSKKSATEATTRAETEVKGIREDEVKHERIYKQAKDILSSLDQILNAMSAAINQAMNERKQGNYHV